MAGEHLDLKLYATHVVGLNHVGNFEMFDDRRPLSVVSTNEKGVLLAYLFV